MRAQAFLFFFPLFILLVFIAFAPPKRTTRRSFEELSSWKQVSAKGEEGVPETQEFANLQADNDLIPQPTESSSLLLGESTQHTESDLHSGVSSIARETSNQGLIKHSGKRAKRKHKNGVLKAQRNIEQTPQPESDPDLQLLFRLLEQDPTNEPQQTPFSQDEVEEEHKLTTATKQDFAREEIHEEEEASPVTESSQSIQHRHQSTLRPPLYLATAIHTDISVLPRLMAQIQPQLDTRWTVDFVIANPQNVKVPPTRNWNAIFDSKEYSALASVVHSITFHEFNTTSKGFRIANDFMLRHDWWVQLPASIEHIWLLQDDSAVCTSHSQFCIYDFLGWDYLGAPWPGYRWRSYWGRWGNVFPRATPSYGNGGFSLRSRRLQVQCTEPNYKKAHRRGDLPEDVFFSMCLRDKSMNFSEAPTEVARKFSTEHPLTIGSFGWHLQSSLPRCDTKMLQYCPEALHNYKRWKCKLPKILPQITSFVPQCHFNRSAA